MRSSSRIEYARPSALTRVLSLGPRDWQDLAVATAELAFARIRVATSDDSALIRCAAPGRSRACKPDERAERVRLAIARAGPRLPWRTDCLVQALAAQRWLLRLGLESSLRIGVPNKARDSFEAHAWLMHGGEVITGGDIGNHIQLFDSAWPPKADEPSQG
jgi:Transglutaminase-like superfamily